MLGAPCFVAAGALRVGAGRVRLVVPPGILQTCLGLVPSAIGCPSTTGLPPQVITDAHTIVAAGPGMGLDRGSQRLIATLMATHHTVVLDGDGLTHLAQQRGSWRKRTAPLVLTPHPGEYARLAERWDSPPLHSTTDPQQRQRAARHLALACGAVVALKGHGTVVSDGRREWTCRTGNPALAIPGSGDVLTGVIAGLLAQGLAPFAATCLGVHLHGMAGDLWAKRHPIGLMAMELAILIPQAVQAYVRAGGRRASRA